MFSSAKVVTFTIAIVLSTRNRTSWSLLRKKLYYTFYWKKVDDIVDSRVVSINFHRTLVGNKNFILAASNFLPRFSELEFFTSQSDPNFAREKKLLSFHNAEKKLPLQFWHTTQIASVRSWWKSFRSVNHEFDHSIKKFIDTRSSWNSSRGVARVESSNRFQVWCHSSFSNRMSIVHATSITSYKKVLVFHSGKKVYWRCKKIFHARVNA